MRRDIKISIKTGDVCFVNNKNNVQTNPFRWIDNRTDLSRYLYGEIDVPSYIPEEDIIDNGLYLNIPYTPIYKEFKLRIKRVYQDGSHSFLINRHDNSVWFTVKVRLYGTGEAKNIYASELLTISEGKYYVLFIDGNLEIYSASQTDFEIGNSTLQNTNCMLACNPGNMYRYPLTGVGLIDWASSNNINNSEMGNRIEKEFKEDGVTIDTAYFDYNTGQLHIEVDKEVE